MKLFIFGAWMNSLCMPDKLVTQGYITLSQAPFFFLVCSVSVSMDGEYFCLEKLKGIWLGPSSVMIKLIFCWKSLFPGHLSLFSEDASLPLSKTRPRLSIRTFPQRLNAGHHYCSPVLGFPTLLEVEEGPRLYFLGRSSIHTWPVDSCCLWGPKTGRCAPIKCWCTDMYPVT